MGMTRFRISRSVADDLVIPSESTELKGAQNWGHPAPIDHMTVASDELSVEQARAFVALEG